VILVRRVRTRVSDNIKDPSSTAQDAFDALATWLWCCPGSDVDLQAVVCLICLFVARDAVRLKRESWNMNSSSVCSN
jgi:hypothetical protein